MSSGRCWSVGEVTRLGAAEVRKAAMTLMALPFLFLLILPFVVAVVGLWAELRDKREAKSDESTSPNDRAA